jgi:isopenicillin N synthase-like dioxygenase
VSRDSPGADTAIPVIDVGPLIRGEHCRQTAAALRDASQNPGFIYISGHGIASTIIDDARSSARTFFALADAEKSRILVSRHHRGWLPQGGARMADDAAADRKESFIWGSDGQGWAGDHSLSGPNLWPVKDFDEFRRAADAWFDAAQQLARVLLGGFATSLGQDPGFFLQSSDRPLSRASYVYYPAQPARTDVHHFGVGPHTDFGVLTVLCQDHVGGLQIENTDGEWIDAPYIDDTLIVNVGDLLARWTNGTFRSASHRVMSPMSEDRLSLVLAFDPNPETSIDPRALFPAADGPEPITCGDYLDGRFDRAFVYRDNAV